LAVSGERSGAERVRLTAVLAPDLAREDLSVGAFTAEDVAEVEGGSGDVGFGCSGPPTGLGMRRGGHGPGPDSVPARDANGRTGRGRTEPPYPEANGRKAARG